MAYVCLQAQECRAFIKNGKLRFQARKIDDNGDVLEQVTISFPKEMASYFTHVENTDAYEDQQTLDIRNRIEDLMNDN